MLNLTEFARHCTGARLRLVDGITGGGQLFFDLVQHAAELAELGLDSRQHLPHFARLLFDGERTETEPQAVQKRGDGGGPADDDPMVLLQLTDQSWLAQHLGIKPLGRQVQHGEVGRPGRVQILLADRFGRLGDGPQQFFNRLGHRVGVPLTGCLGKTQVILLGKLGVDR